MSWRGGAERDAGANKPSGVSRAAPGPRVEEPHGERAALAESWWLCGDKEGRRRGGGREKG